MLRKSKSRADKEYIESPEKSKKRILSAETPFAVAEAYKAARTNTLFTRSGEGCQVIAVTSAFAGEGKSVSCINMALTMALSGMRVLVIDADMRKPVIQRIFGLKPKYVLSEVLAGLTDSRDYTPGGGIICKTSYENVDCLPSGHVPPNPAELLASRGMEALLAELKNHYDYIFIDLPPILVVTDAAVISKYVSGYIAVVRAGKTQMEAVQDAVLQLRQVNANILGFILNDVESRSSYGKYSYKYGRYGRYGRSYAYYGRDASEAGAPNAAGAKT